MTAPHRAGPGGFSRYAAADGVSELALAVPLLSVGALLYRGSMTDAPLSAPQFLLGWIATIAASFAIHRLVAPRLRERITYPRLGYATPRPRPGQRLIAMTLVAVVMVGALVYAAAFRIPAGPTTGLARLVPLLLAAVMAGSFVVFGLRSTTPRFIVVGIWSVAVGLAIAIVGPSTERGISIYFAMMAIALAMSGGVALRQFASSEPATRA